MDKEYNLDKKKPYLELNITENPKNLKKKFTDILSVGGNFSLTSLVLIQK